MKALAQALLEIGVQVSGSDIDEEKAAALRRKGAVVHLGHASGNVGEVDVLVYSTAISEDNPEFQEAMRRGIPIWHRSEMLGWFLSRYESVLVAGTHGKTTTTTMVTLLLEAGGLQPWSFVGGYVKEFGGNSLVGAGSVAVAEADESDGSFLALPRRHAIITNIEDEHLNYWGTSDRMFEGYEQFVAGLPSDGILAVCIDDPGIRQLLPRVDRSVVTYTTKARAGADFSAVGIKTTGSGSSFTLMRGNDLFGRVELGVPGLQNVANATGALALALSMGQQFESIVGALREFRGVDRRFSKFEAPNGVLVIDDYGHHPTEIRVTVESARLLANERGGRLIAILQPHRYSRTQSFFGDFAGSLALADEIIVTEIYGSGESPIAGISGASLAGDIAGKIQGTTEFLAGFDEIKKRVESVTKNGDIVLLLGAGSITKLVNLLTAPVHHAPAVYGG
jgi:UDP-N-acetylmuramate--alanine ligase